MEKTIIALWREPDRDPSELTSAMLDSLAPALESSPQVRCARLQVEAPEAAGLRVGEGDHGLLSGLVSLWSNSYEDLDVLDETFAALPAATTHGWLVTESVPLPRRAEQVGLQPGLTMTTLLNKAAGVSEAEFYRMWHEVHSKTTLELHPVVSYHRNEVLRALTPGAPSLRGIVYEATASAEDMLDPRRFYGRVGDDKDALKANIERIIAETSAFIDFTTLQTVAMHEHLIRPASW